LREALPGLRERWPIHSLARFGSWVRQDATPDSDLDVLVEFAGPVSLSSFLALEETLAAITGRAVGSEREGCAVASRHRSDARAWASRVDRHG